MTSFPGWYITFFTDPPDEFWRHAVPPEANAADVAFIEERLGQVLGSRALDVPCGSGRHALTLAARGHRVTGRDVSGEAIAYARAPSSDAGLDVDRYAGWARDVNAALDGVWTGSYVTHLGADETAGGYGADQRARLAALKATHDPDGVFRLVPGLSAAVAAA